MKYVTSQSQSHIYVDHNRRVKRLSAICEQDSQAHVASEDHRGQPVRPVCRVPMVIEVSLETGVDLVKRVNAEQTVSRASPANRDYEVSAVALATG